MKTMKKLRKMLSVILCVVISCMCFATPVCAAGKTEASVMGTNTPNMGIQRLAMYPAIVDSNGDIYYADPSTSPTYVSGTDFLNFTVSPKAVSQFREYGCNAWLFQIHFCSDNTFISYIEFEVDNEILATEKFTSSDQITFLINDKDYFTYRLIYHLKSGGTMVSGGHVNVR